MSERATAYSLPPQVTTPSPGTELTVRPKVLRRPAHFNAKSIPIEAPMPVIVPLNPAPQAAAKLAPAGRAWQDDGKFAITLLALVILVNLAVSAWLSAISPEKPAIVQSASAPIIASTVHVLDTSARDISEQ